MPKEHFDFNELMVLLQLDAMMLDSIKFSTNQGRGRIDVGHILDVTEGDEVVLIGKQNGVDISAEEVASATNTINYEVVSSITSRVPRLYIGGR